MAAATAIMITGARAPVALHLARLLAGAGHKVTLVDQLANPVAAASRLGVTYRRIPSFATDRDAARAALSRIITRDGIGLVVPTCEEVLHLAAIWAQGPMAAPLFAPDLAMLQQVHNKATFITLCDEIGLQAPRTRLLTSTSERRLVDAEADRLVFKPVWSRFGSRVLIRPSKAQLRRVRPSAREPWIAQEHLTGTELCAYAVARQGKVVALAAYRGLVRAGPGAAVCFAPVDGAIVRPFVARFVQATGWTGQISFDLMQQEDGRILPLECNPRATSGLHFFSDAAGFAAAMTGAGGPIAPDIGTPLAVRLALWLYGAPMLLHPAQRRLFRDAVRHAGDVMDWPGDRVGTAPQLRAVAEMAAIALRQRISLQRAATWGIEWNGGDQISI